MRTLKKMLLIATMLLGGIAQASAGVVNLGGWESTNHDDGSTGSHSVTFVGTQLQFNWTVDSESGYDKLIVKLDGDVILEASGNQSDTYANYNLASGTHTVEFQYVKDGSSSNGADKAVISDITIFAAETISHEGLEYISNNDNTLSVTGCSLQEGELVIPSTITVEGVDYSVTTIASGVFRDCKTLTSITIPATITSIGSNAFSGCEGELIVNCAIPENYSENGVFRNSKFTKVTIGETVDSIGSYAFYGCSALQEVVLPENSLKYIGSYAFYGCSSMQITVPASVKSIGNYAFSECTVIFAETNPNWFTNNGESWAFGSAAAIIVPDEAYEAYLSSDNWSKYHSKITVELERPNYTFTDDNGITWNYKYTHATKSVRITKVEGYSTEIDVPGTLPCGEQMFPVGAINQSFSDDVNIEKVDLSKTAMTTIPSFRSCTTLASILLPATLKSIGESTFYECTNLQTVDFTNATELDSIANHAFYNCDNLKTIDLSATKVKVIENDAFNSNERLESIVFPATLEKIGYDAFCYCHNLASIDLSATKLKYIGSRSFYYCNNLQSVSLPNTLKTINDHSFHECYNLRKINLSAVEEISEGTFISCSSIDTLDLSSAKKIGSQAFNTNIKFTINSTTPATINVNSFTDGSTFIVTPEAYDAFCTAPIWKRWVDNISMYTIDAEGVKWIYRYLKTTNSMSITSVTGYGQNVVVPSYLPYNGVDVPVTHLERLFSGADITSVTLPSNLVAINSSSFSNCDLLKEIVIPNTVTKIGDQAFYDCASLANIALSTSLTTIGERAFYNCDSLTTIEIPNSVTQIGYGAFRQCSSLSNVTLPDSLKELAACTFENCNALSAIDIPKGVKKIGENSLAGTSIRVLTVPASVDTIVQGAFPSSMRKMVCERPTPPVIATNSDGMAASLGNIFIVYVPKGCRPNYITIYPWSSNRVIVDGSGVAVNVNVAPGMMGEEILKHTDYLSDVNFLILSGAVNETDINNLKNSMPNLLTIDMKGLDMTYIPSSLFANRRAILNVTLPDNVETIGGAAFANCINLDSIVLPEGLAKLENAIDGRSDGGCFSNCDLLKSVTFPSSLKEIGTYAFYSCSYLDELTFGDSLKTIGDNAFSNCYNIQEIKFNNGVENIGNQAFSYCRSLTSLQFPKRLRTIAAGAFKNCSNLLKIEFAEGVVSIGEESESDYYYGERRGAFEDCASLQKVILPNSLRNIYQYTFSNCDKLTYIKIPEGVNFIGKNAFSSCDNLVKVDLPSTLYRCSTAPFSECTKLAEVNCMALIPPTLADGLLTLNDMGMPLQRILNVPEWTVNRYKLSSGWAAFSKILPILGAFPSSINIVGDAILTLPDSLLPANYKPDMSITSYYYDDYASSVNSSLHLRGTDTLFLNKFILKSSDSYMGDVTLSQLLNDANMQADSVVVSMELSNYNYYENGRTTWYFLSFPFDVKISDVVTGTDWVVRKYDGKARASNKLNNTWVTVPYNSTLNAGLGYIWSSSGGSFTLPALDNANKNNIFANNERKVALQEYKSEFVSNSSWNLIGNPFPCYYDSRFMDFTAPITVWNTYNNTYSAYSPVDDNYVFHPFEAFFVQRPEKVDTITFNPGGRQLTSTPKVLSNVRVMSDMAIRTVFNLTLSNDKNSDRTRVVINEAAKMDYETECDAAKFMSSDAGMFQLFTVAGNEKYAINERPLGDGVVAMGIYIPSAGQYTISMNHVSDYVVYLADLKTGNEVNLTQEDYTFNAEAGMDNRFELRFYSDKETTAVETVDASQSSEVVVSGGAIVVNNAKDAKVSIYNVAGKLIANGQGKSMTFDVVPGLYIVDINGASQKVHVTK